MIRAHDHAEAGRLADAVLGSMLTACTTGDRSVQPFCHKIIEIASDGSSFSNAQAEVLMGPWIAYGYSVHHVGYPAWNRDHLTRDVWEQEKHDAQLQYGADPSQLL